MNNKIVLKDGKELVGVSNIVISEIDNKIFINHSSQIGNSIQGSLAIYYQDETATIIGAGKDCIWDKDSSTLKVKKISIERWFGFKSRIVENSHAFKIKVIINPNTGKEALLFTSNEYDNLSVPIKVIGFEDDRFVLLGKTNILSKKVESPIGKKTDRKGDFSIDENFIYYCVKDYDGISKIWKRSILNDW